MVGKLDMNQSTQTSARPRVGCPKHCHNDFLNFEGGRFPLFWPWYMWAIASSSWLIGSSSGNEKLHLFMRCIMSQEMGIHIHQPVRWNGWGVYFHSHYINVTFGGHRSGHAGNWMCCAVIFSKTLCSCILSTCIVLPCPRDPITFWEW